MEDSLEEELENVEKRVNAMLKCEPSDIHKFLYLSGVSRKQFIEGFFSKEFPQEEAIATINELAQVSLVPKKVREGLSFWKNISSDEQKRLLGEAYDALMQLPEYDGSER